jgi:hypothetical protein
MKKKTFHFEHYSTVFRKSTIPKSTIGIDEIIDEECNNGEKNNSNNGNE